MSVKASRESDLSDRLQDVERKLDQLLVFMADFSPNVERGAGLPVKREAQKHDKRRQTEEGQMTEAELYREYIRSIARKRHLSFAKMYCPYPRPFPEDIDPSKYNPNIALDMVKDRGCFRYRRAWLYHFMHDESLSVNAERLEYVIFSLIIISTISYIFSTVDSWDSVMWEVIEIIVSICFTIEYIARISSVRNLHWYIIKPLNLVDLIAVLPWYIEKLTGASGTGLRVLRVVRLARVFRLRSMMEEYTEIITRAITRTVIQSSGMVSLIILLELSVCSSLMYVLEKDEGNGFDNIPISMYWCMVTITTVGYGDMYPITDAGRFLACITMFTGLIVIACVVIMFGGNFEEAQSRFVERRKEFARLYLEDIQSQSNYTATFVSKEDSKESVTTTTETLPRNMITIE